MMAAARRQNDIRLSELIPDIDTSIDQFVSALVADSRQVGPGSVFFARRGLTVDATIFVDDAIRKGAVAVVREGHAGVRMLSGGIPEISVVNLAATLGHATHRFYGEPSKHLRLTGVTGTNGKTSIGQFLAHALNMSHGQSTPTAGIIGTLGFGPVGKLESGILTTPDVVDVHRILADMRSAGLRDVVMEVSSHALVQGRVEGVHFKTAVFTNLTRDHLDFHENMAAYGAAKAQLFSKPGLSHAVINTDDEFGRELLENLPQGVDAIAYALGEVPAQVHRRAACLLRGRILKIGETGLEIEIRLGAQAGHLAVPLLGRFNALNLLATAGALIASEVTFDAAVSLLNDIPQVPGRMQAISGGDAGPLVVVDYSHTPDALMSALMSLREHCTGRLWCVFGCGGDRDRGKRAEMGAAAEALADIIVLTDDNPRSEDGDRIIKDICDGFARRTVDEKTVHVERDRASAIALAVNNAVAGDVVLVAGKGHENYQEVKGIRRPFSDAAAIRNALKDGQRD